MTYLNLVSICHQLKKTVTKTTTVTQAGLRHKTAMNLSRVNRLVSLESNYSSKIGIAPKSPCPLKIYYNLKTPKKHSTKRRTNLFQFM